MIVYINWIHILLPIQPNNNRTLKHFASYELFELFLNEPQLKQFLFVRRSFLSAKDAIKVKYLGFVRSTPCQLTFNLAYVLGIAIFLSYFEAES